MVTRERRHRSLPVILLAALTSASCACAGGDAEARISVDAAKPLWRISKYLTGMHFVYGHEPDALYRNNPEILDWMRQARVGIIRWPGGTAVMSYHWNDLNGYSFPSMAKELTGDEHSDSWDPQYQLPKRDPSQFMDLEEFIAICRQVGAAPCIGINVLSGKKFGRLQDSYAEARALIQHCVDKGYGVKFWYIGNEGYAKGFSAETYAQTVDTYAAILRKVAPDITIIGDWKYGPQTEKKNRFQETLKIVASSTELDLIEFHEKWAEDWGLVSGRTVADWLGEAPYLYRGRLTDCAHRVLDFARKIGKDKLRVGYNEWGFGDPRLDANGEPFDLHRMGLLGADYLIEIFRAPIATACYWNLNIGRPQTRIFTVNKDGTVTMNPIRHPFTMVAKAMGEDLLELQSTLPTVYGFASKSENGIQLFLMNKSEKPATVHLQVSGVKLDQLMEVESYEPPGVIRTRTIEGTSAQLPALSFTRIQYRLSAAPENR